MGFRDFINRRLFQKREIERLVQRLLTPSESAYARDSLIRLGISAAPALVAAARSNHVRGIPSASFRRPPWFEALEALTVIAPKEIPDLCLPLVTSKSPDEREYAAFFLARTGYPEIISALAKLLDDPVGNVRCWVCIGIGRALVDKRCGAEFCDRMYELLLPQCDLDWDEENRAPETIFAINSVSAARDFSSLHWLRLENPNVQEVLSAANKRRIPLAATPVRDIFDSSFAEVDALRRTRFDRIAGLALENLAMSTGEECRGRVTAGLECRSEYVSESAARALCTLAGLVDPIRFVLREYEEHGIAGVTLAQQTVYCAQLFHWEVCNGGISQFFSNSSGDHAVETLSALQRLEHKESEELLAAAFEVLGPSAKESNRSKRDDGLSGKWENLQPLKPLESALFKTSSALQKRIFCFAAEHAEDFRSIPRA